MRLPGFTQLFTKVIARCSLVKSFALLSICLLFIIFFLQTIFAVDCSSDSECSPFSAVFSCSSSTTTDENGENPETTQAINLVTTVPECRGVTASHPGSCLDPRDASFTCKSSCVVSGSAECNVVDSYEISDSDFSRLNNRAYPYSYCAGNYRCEGTINIKYIRLSGCTEYYPRTGVCKKFNIKITQEISSPTCSKCNNVACTPQAPEQVTERGLNIPAVIPKAICSGTIDDPLIITCESNQDCVTSGGTRLTTPITSCNNNQVCTSQKSAACVSGVCQFTTSAESCVACQSGEECTMITSDDPAVAHCKSTSTTMNSALLPWNYNVVDPVPSLMSGAGKFDYERPFNPDSTLLGSLLELYSVNPKDEKKLLKQKDENTGGRSFEEECNLVGRLMGGYTHYDSIDFIETDAIHVCSNGGLEGKYDIILESEGKKGLSTSSADRKKLIASNMAVDWNRYESWCTKGDCGASSATLGWVGTHPLPERCCSAREMNAAYNYTMEDCNQIISYPDFAYLCYIPKNSTFDAVTQGEWIPAENIAGEILYEGCGNKKETTSKNDGIEYVVSSDKRWISCTNSGFSTGGNILNIQGYDSNSVANTHGYICVNWIAPLKHSIGECSPVIDERIDNTNDRFSREGGFVATQGDSANVSGNSVYFCAHDANWTTDLDSKQASGTDGIVCNSAKFPASSYEDYDSPSIGSKWTGSKCCGELDDWYGTYPTNTQFAFNNPDYVNREYYNDDDRIPGGYFSNNAKGACFNGVYQENETYLTLKYKNYTGALTVVSHPPPIVSSIEVPEVIVWHGSFQGCAIDHEDALVEKNTTDNNPGKIPQPLVCAIPPTSRTAYDGSMSSFSPEEYGYPAGQIHKRNDFLLSLKDFPNPKGARNSQGGTQLIHDNEYCNIKNSSQGNYYYCSYAEIWKEETIEENVAQKTHLSFIPWKNSSAQQAECCTPSECWDGNTCVGSVYASDFTSVYKIENGYGDGFICKNGTWEWSYKKSTWDGTQDGYCYENTQCLVSPEGTISQTNVFGPLKYSHAELAGVGVPRCINSGEFYNDHYCEDGTWTTRTKYVAAALQDIGNKQSSPYTLYCDRYDKVLNHFDYSLNSGVGEEENIQLYFDENAQSGCLSFDGLVPCVNHVCVLAINPSGPDNQRKIIFGTSINHRINKSSSDGGFDAILDFGKVFGGSLSSCINHERKTDTIQSCGTNIFYRGDMSLVFYSRDMSVATPPSDYVSIIRSIFTNFIGTFVTKITPSQSSSTISGWDYSTFVRLADDMYASSNSMPSQARPNYECENCTDNNENGETKDEVCNINGNPRSILDLNTLYLSKSGSKTIFGLAEVEHNSLVQQKYIYGGFTFTGFNTDICSTFHLPLVDYSCVQGSSSNIRHVVFKPTPMSSENTDNSFASLVDTVANTHANHWKYIGTSTRISAESSSSS